MNSSFRTLLAVFAFAAGALILTPSAEAATITICDSGCDYTSLDTAVAADIAGPDTYILTTGYTALEDGNRFLSDDTTLTCDPGVAFRQDVTFPGYTYFGSNVVIQDCQLQDIAFNKQVGAVTNVSWLNNTLLPKTQLTSGNTIYLGDTQSFTISGNTGHLRESRYNGSSDGMITGNNFHCTESAGCFIFEGGADDITIDDNTLQQSGHSSYGQITISNATNITVTNNILSSLPVQNNGYIMISIYNQWDNIQISNNFFQFPEHGLITSGGSTAIHISAPDADANISIEQNSMVSTSTPSTNNGISYKCLNIIGGSNVFPVKQLNVEYRYNFCQNGSTASQDYGIGLSYDPTYHSINFTDEHNGFTNVDQVIFDEFGPLTIADLSETTLNSNPVFRTENADPLDDHLFAPMSRYLDVNGTRDIGYYDGGARDSSYTIDDNCVVNYTTCHSQTTDVLDDVLKPGDVVTIAAGTYPGVSITGPMTDITIQGAGPATIFDGSLNFQSALTITNVTSSIFSDIRLVNSTETAPIITSGYVMSLAVLSFGGNDYDDAGGVLLVEDPGPTLGGISADGDPVVVDGVTNINGFLFDLGGVYFTVLAPENIADSMLDIETLLGPPPSHFIEDLYVADGSGNYTFNSTNIDNQGITVMAGSTLPPTLVNGVSITRSYTAAGLKLDNASDNTFENVLLENNDVGVLYINGATGNVIEDSVFDTNAMLDVMSYSFGGINDLLNSTFSRTSSAVDAGLVRAIFDSSIRIVDPLMAPLAGVGVNFTSMNGLINTNATTDISGLTPVIETVAYIMSPTSTALTSGGYNPFTITANASGPYSTTSTPATLSGITVFELAMSVAPVTPPPVSIGSGGGGLPTIDPRTGTYPPIEPVEPVAATKPILIKETKAHMLVKLLDDGNPETQEDSTVYYLGADGKRHLFPNQSVFNSWYCDFSKVVSVEPRTLAKYPIGKNVTYRPGLNMVKFPTNPNVYVVQPGRVLRHIKDEAAAISMFSSNWAKLVYDLSDTTYGDYIFGDELAAITDLSVLNQSPSYPSGEMDIEGYLDIVTGGQACR